MPRLALIPNSSLFVLHASFCCLLCASVPLWLELGNLRSGPCIRPEKTEQ
jgi:hypothetical protein